MNKLFALGLLLSPLLVVGAESDSPDWPSILSKSSETKWPEPLDELKWRSDLAGALDEAKRSDRPLFVTLRCLPCKQCAQFDKDVLEGGPALSPLLRQFVTVRLTTMRDVDRRLLPYVGFQDLDLSWWGYLLSPAGELYGVYGGRDEISDATRISVPSLARTLTRVLDHHNDPRRASWEIDGAAYDRSGPAKVADGLPGWTSWEKRGFAEAERSECLHCHQVNEILRQPRIDANEFDKHSDFSDWPFPENAGLVLDRDDGLRVNEVIAESAAETAGLRPGDALAAAGGRRLFSQADFRGVLHRAEHGTTSIDVVLLRDGEVLSKELKLEAGWRASDLGWRKSVAEADVGAHPGFSWPLETKAGARRRRGIPEGTMAVTPYFGRGKPRGPAADAGLRGGDVIVSVNGESPDVFSRAFMVWFRLAFEPGDEVELEVVNGKGEKRKLRYTAK